MLLSGLSVVSLSYAQTAVTIDSPLYLPLSPQATALHRAVNYPVSGNTGVPDISIPLYTITSGGITVPITLRYSTTNVKIDKSTVPNVAFGWVLDVGGSVNRTIKGKPDEAAVMYPLDSSSPYNLRFNQIDNLDDQQTLSKIYSWVSSGNDYDSEYDDFYFTNPGGSGNFYIKRNNTTTLNSSFSARFSPSVNYKLASVGRDYSLQAMITSLTIKDDKGIEYLYGGAKADTVMEYSRYAALDMPFSTGWNLSRIKDDIGNTVTFKYSYLGDFTSSYTQDQWYSIEDNIQAQYAGDLDAARDYMESFTPDARNSTETFNVADFRSLLPREISYKEGKVLFTIENSTIKEITILDQAGTQIRKIVFNKTANDLNLPILALAPMLNSIEVKDANNTTIQTYDMSYNTVTYSGNVNCDYWGYFNGTTANPFCYLPDKSFTAIGYNGVPFVFNLGNNGNRTPDASYIMHNVLKSITYPSGGKTEFGFEPNIYSKERNSSLSQTYIGPGLRINEVIHKDKDGALLKKMSYTYGVGSIPIRPDIDGYNKITTYTANVGDDNMQIITYICPTRSWRVTPKYSPYVAFGGETIVYENVGETIYDGTESKGKKINYFVNPVNFQFSTYFANANEVPSGYEANFQHIYSESFSYDNSYLDKTEEFDMQNVLVKRTSYYYSIGQMDELMNLGLFHLFFYNYPASISTPGLISDYSAINTMKLRSGGAEIPFLPPLLYYFYTSGKGVRYPAGEKTEYFYNEKSFNQEKTISYDLQKPFHYPVKTKELTSNGLSIEKYYTYPFNYPGNSVLDSLVARNIVSPVIEQKRSLRTSVNDSILLDRFKVDYSRLNNGSLYYYRPYDVYYSTGSNALEQRLRYNRYDPMGNPSSILANNNQNVNYVWAYSYIYPVAMIEGATFSEMSSAMGSSYNIDQVGYSLTPSENTLNSMFGSFRAIPASLTNGRIFRPHYGVSKEVSPSSKTTIYGYDSFQRLANILDNSNYILSQFAYSDVSGTGNTYTRIYNPDTTVTNINSIPYARQRIRTIYTDGIYRPIQEVLAYCSPNQNDIITYTKYNCYGNADKQSLPYAATVGGGSYRSSAESEQFGYYDNIYSGEGGYASSRKSFEESPLQRPIEEYLSGSGSYATSGSATTRYQYGINGVNEVILWSVNTSNEALINNGYYSEGMLHKTTITDPDGRVTIRYADRQGLEVETRQGSQSPLVTSYVYDVYGRLGYVIPPLAQSSSPNTQLCYKYSYDHRNRKKESYVPEKGTTYYVYDADNRLVCSQDPVQRSLNKWTFTRYDRLGRELYSGIAYYSGTLQNLRDDYANNSYSESFTGSGSIGGYTNTSQTLSAGINDVLKIAWYDNYNQSDKISFSAMGNEVGQPAGYAYLNAPYGLVTGTKVKVLDGNEHTASAIWLTSTMYYNTLEELIQAVSETYTGTDKGQERTSTGYRNQREVYAIKTASTANGVTTTLLDQKGYDPRGRLVHEWHSINGGTPVLVSSLTYDETGRMVQNALGNSLVTNTFTYDIQNRLRKINDPSNLGTKPFALELQYSSPNVTGATAQFAGNISAARWKHLSGGEQTYYYNYDSYSRMTAGYHNGNNNEQSIGYDSNGNISALTRTGVQSAGLSYTYSGNRLTSLTKDGTSYSYAYDSNGNTTTDGLRGMSIAYNYLNLPKTVTKGSDVLTYIYDAAGSKLAEKLNTTVNNFYTGAVVYKGDKTIDYIQTPTGIVRKVGADFIRQYNINDHLGNVRAVVNQSGTIEQATDFYPYGLAFSYNNLDKNRYLYNGKELQNQSLATTFFGMYDYGARYYDPMIGRWNSVDPMAEKTYEWSPYNYCYNNPLRFIDPDGMLSDDPTGFLKGWNNKVQQYNNEFYSALQDRLEDPKLLLKDAVNMASGLMNLATDVTGISNIVTGENKTAEGLSGMINMVTDFPKMSGEEKGSVLAGVGIAAMEIALTKKVPVGKIGATTEGVQYSGDLLKTAQKLYPNKAGKIEFHHITPKYLGGAKNGPLVPIDASYHQVITNDFRVLWPYGKGVPSATELQNIKKQIYSKYPLPSGN